MKIYTDKDASLEPLQNMTIAVLGYGNQGRAQALNMRDQGLTVVVGNRDDKYRKQAIEDGFICMEIKDAARAGDILFILTTDESQPLIWEREIAPGIDSGNALVWASGYNVGFNLIVPPTENDVMMVAPRMPGTMVRTLFENGTGAMAQVAVHRDISGRAWEKMMALAKGIGATRGGVFESSFREEAEIDLFAEQIVWPGLCGWIEECFKLGVDQGFPPELMVLELYAAGETAGIMKLMGEHGFYKSMTFHSTTSQYGTLSRTPQMLNQENRDRMLELFKRDIRGGAFSQEWKREQEEGSKTLKELRNKALESPMSRAEESVIPLVQKAQRV